MSSMEYTTGDEISSILDIHNTGMHLESMDEFSISYYKDVYMNAFLQLEHIIQQSASQEDNIYGRNNFGNNTNHNTSYERFSNILTFVGRRGTGKTSVMLSFMEALRAYNGYNMQRSKNKQFFKFQEKDSEILFTCLNCIDGSLLEHGEDIFKIVLAQLYQKFKDLEQKDEILKNDDFDYRKRELFQKLENIYKTVCEIDNMGEPGRLPGESYMTSLKNLSSSQKVKRDFENLINMFTALMKYKELGIVESKSWHYVIITVDDIDMNLDNGFSMLEKIHRYCMVPNVIVLLSVDMEQMISLVVRNFYELLPKVNRELILNKKYIQKLALDYLDKVIPVNYRIYLPEITDSFSYNSIRIKEEKVDIKHTILGKYYRRIGICFDSQGRKRHFYEPKSMRQLTGYYLMLNSLKSVDLTKLYGSSELTEKEERELVQRWENNSRILMSDVSKRLAFEKVYKDREVFELFEMIIQEDISRSKDLLKAFYERLAVKYEFDITHELSSEGNYSYGEFVEDIYCMGRIQAEKYKPLVHCLLAYFSYAFTRIYIYERLGIKDQAGNLLVRNGELKRLIGKNVINEWACDFLPKVALYEEIDEGIGEGADSKKLTSAFSVSLLKDAPLSLISKVDLKTEKELEGNLQSKRKYFAYIIRNVEMFLLFLSNIRENMEAERVFHFSELKFQIDYNRFSGKPALAISGIHKEISYIGDFNIMNVIMNSMYASEELKEVEKNLKDCFESQYEIEDEGNKRIFGEGFEDTLKLHSLQGQYEGWESKYGKGTLPLPVYWFDFTYNVLKRTWKNMKGNNPVYIRDKEALDYISILYDCIGAQLEDQVRFYELGAEKVTAEREIEKEGRYPANLKNIFMDCPAVKYFVDRNSKVTVEEMNNRRSFIAGLIKKMKEFSGEI